MPRLLECHRSAYSRLAERVDRVVVAGKSMGGRVGGHLAAEGSGADRLVFYGYPLVPIGASEPRDTSHLDGLGIPMLFLQGERDRMAPLEMIRVLVGDLDAARLETIPEADHSFRVPKRTGLDPAGVLDRLASWTLEFVRE
jgi:predicted alpha/beta-hydrolase family hydrolase